MKRLALGLPQPLWKASPTVLLLRTATITQTTVTPSRGEGNGNSVSAQTDSSPRLKGRLEETQCPTSPRQPHAPCFLHGSQFTFSKPPAWGRRLLCQCGSEKTSCPPLRCSGCPQLALPTWDSITATCSHSDYILISHNRVISIKFPARVTTCHRGKWRRGSSDWKGGRGLS